MASLKLICSIASVMVMMMSAMAEAAMTCVEVKSNLAPCVPYMTSSGGGTVPPPACCDGVKRLSNASDRQQVCNCIDQSAIDVPFNITITAELPGECGLDISSASADCFTMN